MWVDFEKAEHLAIRREELGRNVPPCPSCHESMQLQLVAYIDALPQWRCRTCGEVFSYDQA